MIPAILRFFKINNYTVVFRGFHPSQFSVFESKCSVCNSHGGCLLMLTALSIKSDQSPDESGC